MKIGIYEIEPRVIVTIGDRTFVEPPDYGEEPEFYGVYERDSDGFAVHVEDFDTLEEAEAFARRQGGEK